MKKSNGMRYTGVLFDLDGTLLNTAPDLTHTMNQLLKKYQQPPITIASLLPYISAGSRGMLQYAFKLSAEDRRLASLCAEYIALHHANTTHNTQMYAGIQELIQTLKQHEIRWGIVTNKTHALAEKVLSQFEFADDSGCLVGADTLPQCKPHPEPLWYATGLLGLRHEQCLYVGDAKTDVQASLAAGMDAALAAYGYVPPGAEIQTWGAKYCIYHPLELLDVVIPTARRVGMGE